MTDSYGFDDSPDPPLGGDDGTDTGGPEIGGTIRRARRSTNALGLSANAFANAMTKAFSQAAVGGKQFDDVLKSLALRLSSMTLAAAFKPVATGISKGLGQVFGDIFGQLFPGSASGGGGGGGGNGLFAPTNNCCCCQPSNGGCFGTGGPPNIFTTLPRFISPFAAGGVIGTPSYFPLSSGGLGLAGEAGSEAIVPLARGRDGRLGIAQAGGGVPANITVQITTPDADSFRRSEAYLTGQIARAVARGQRSL